MSLRLASPSSILTGGAILAAGLFLPLSQTYFVADDWPVILRNASLSWPSTAGWWVKPRFGWYRPLFDTYIGLSWRWFGPNPLPYHLLSFALFCLVALLLARIAWLISGDRRVAAWSGVLFLVLACHAEAVMWIASANELLAGLWSLASLASYLQFRQCGRRRWLVLAVLTAALALTSKETALFLPIMLIIADLCLYNRFTGRPFTVRTLLVIAPVAFLAAVVAVLRFPAGTYQVSYQPLQLAKNLVYYLLVETVAFPLRAADIVSPSALAPTVLASASLLLAALLYARSQPGFSELFRPVLFALGLTLSALVPVIPIVAERTTFLSSAGVALLLALLGVSLWQRVAPRSRLLSSLTVAAVAGYLGANATVLDLRAQSWALAGHLSESVITQLNAYLPGVPADTDVWLLELPDQVGNAYAFRNAFPEAGMLLGYPQRVNAMLDTDLHSLSDAGRAERYAQLLTNPKVLLVQCQEGRLRLEGP